MPYSRSYIGKKIWPMGREMQEYTPLDDEEYLVRSRHTSGMIPPSPSISGIWEMALMRLQSRHAQAAPEERPRIRADYERFLEGIESAKPGARRELMKKYPL